MYAQVFEVFPQVPPTLAKVEELESDNEPTLDEKHATKVEQKPCPSSLWYEFLGPNSTYPVIFNPI